MFIAPLEYVTIDKFAELSGYTAKAIRNKIDTGLWKENELWKKAPDGRILIIILGYYAWLEAAGSKSRRQGRSKSSSSIRGSSVEKDSKLLEHLTPWT